MTLHFTGTGKRRYVAKRIVEILYNELPGMNGRSDADQRLPVGADKRLRSRQYCVHLPLPNKTSIKRFSASRYHFKAILKK